MSIKMKVKEFCKKHKKALILGGLIGGGVIGYSAFRRRGEGYDYTYLDTPTLDKGNLNYVARWKRGTHAGDLAMGMTSVPVTELGKVGEKLQEIDGIENDSCVALLVATGIE